MGNPDSFRFDVVEPGAIANAANLAVTPGNNLSLVGGTVVNEGMLEAPGGDILLSAVEGENLAKITIPGNLLSLEVQTLPDIQPTNITPSSLADLLTGGQTSHATELQENGGEAILTGSGISVGETGTVTNLGIAQAENIAIQGKKIVQGADLTTTGGDVFLDGENIELADDVTIATNDGNIEISGAVDGDRKLELNAGAGEIALGSQIGSTTPLSEVEITAENVRLTGDVSIATDNGQLKISGLVDGNHQLALDTGTGDVVLQDEIGSITPLSGIEISAGNIDLQSDVRVENGVIALHASNGIVIQGLVSSSGGDIDILAAGGDITINDSQAGAEISSSPGGKIAIESGNGNILGAADIVSEGDVRTPDGGEIELKAKENIEIGAIATSAQSNGNAGEISVEAGESITTGNLRSRADEIGNGAPITFEAGSSITVNGSIIARAREGNAGSILFSADENIEIHGTVQTVADRGMGGDATLMSANGGIALPMGAIVTGVLDKGDGGDVVLTAKTDIQTNEIFTATPDGNAGTIAVKTDGSFTVTAGLLAGHLEALFDEANLCGQGGIACNADGSIAIQAKQLNELILLEGFAGFLNFGFGEVTIRSLSSATPSPDASPTPTPNPNPAPSSAPSPEPAPGPELVSSPEPTPGPELVSSPEPTLDPEPVSTPELASFIGIEENVTQTEVDDPELPTIAANSGNGGNVNTTSSQDTNIEGSVNTFARGGGDDGDVNIVSGGDTPTGAIDTTATDGGQSGDVDINSGGNTTTGDINAGGDNPGDVAIVSGGTVTTGEIEGGEVTIVENFVLPATGPINLPAAPSPAVAIAPPFLPPEPPPNMEAAIAPPSLPPAPPPNMEAAIAPPSLPPEPPPNMEAAIASMLAPVREATHSDSSSDDRTIGCVEDDPDIINNNIDLDSEACAPLPPIDLHDKWQKVRVIEEILRERYPSPAEDSSTITTSDDDDKDRAVERNPDTTDAR